MYFELFHCHDIFLCLFITYRTNAWNMHCPIYLHTYINRQIIHQRRIQVDSEVIGEYNDWERGGAVLP